MIDYPIDLCNQTIREFVIKVNKTSYPFVVESHGHFIFNINGKKYRLNRPKESLALNFCINYENVSHDNFTEILCATLEIAVDEFKNKWDINDNYWIGKFNILEPIYNINDYKIYITITGNLINISKVINDENFNNKLLETINEDYVVK